MALGMWAKDYLGPKEAGGSGGGGITIATLTLTSDTTATCDMSWEEIRALLESGKPVLAVWAYKPDGAPFFVYCGSDLICASTGTLKVFIAENAWTCQSSDGYNWVSRS